MTGRDTLPLPQGNGGSLVVSRAKLLGSEVYGWIYTLDGPAGRVYRALKRDASVAVFPTLREAERWLRSQEEEDAEHERGS
jgi:hypothetical protein